MLDNLYPPQPSQVIVDIAPVYSALHSFVSVADARHSPGISDWSLRTRDALTESEWQQHHLLAKWIGIEALSNVAGTPDALASFPAYLRFLTGRTPTPLRDDLLYWMVARPSARLLYKPARPQLDDLLSLLESEQAFAAFFDPEDKGKEERAALSRLYGYLIDPPALHSFVTGTLDHFWQAHLVAEWARMLPELEKAMAAVPEIDTTGLSHFEVIETLTRRNLRGVYRAEVLSEYTVLRFIPSFHCGPYILRFAQGQELRIVFGAHRLLDLARGGEEVDHGYAIDRMKALGDETRLQIIQLLRTHGELQTQEIIDRLDLSRSAASRHLRQLHANNIVAIRVDADGTKKYYRLDPGAQQEMQNLLAKLLG